MIHRFWVKTRIAKAIKELQTVQVASDSTKNTIQKHERSGGRSDRKRTSSHLETRIELTVPVMKATSVDIRTYCSAY
jgi:hypothetical protein